MEEVIVVLENTGIQERSIQTLNGDLNLKRSAMRLQVFTNDSQRIKLYDEVIKPLDENFKIDKLEYKMSPRMIDETAFWGQNQSSFAWAEFVMKKLGYSATDSTIQKITHSVGKKLYQEDTKNRPDGVPNIYKYVCDNRNKIDYDNYKKSGFYIGSGPVESANKTVLHQRCKGPGMMWDEYYAHIYSYA